MTGRIIDLPLELNHFWIWVIAISSLKLSWTAFSTSFVFLKEWLNIIKSKLRALSHNSTEWTVSWFNFFFFKEQQSFTWIFFRIINTILSLEDLSLKLKHVFHVCVGFKHIKNPFVLLGEKQLSTSTCSFVPSMALLFLLHFSSCRRHDQFYRARQWSPPIQQPAYT